MYKSIFLIATLCVLLVRAQDSGAHPDPDKRAAIEQLLISAKAEQLMAQTLAQVKSTIATQVEKGFAATLPNSDEFFSKYRPEIQKFEEQITSLIADRLSWPRMKPLMVKLYDETFTKDEIVAIEGFYKTPGGQALLEKMPILTQKSMALGQGMMSDAMPQIQKMTLDFMESMKKHENKPPQN